MRTLFIVTATIGALLAQEHFFSRKHGYATTLCDLKNHSVYDVVLGRSEASLEGYFHSLEGKGLVRVASVYGAIVRTPHEDVS